MSELEEMALRLRSFATHRHSEGLNGPEGNITPMAEVLTATGPIAVGVDPLLLHVDRHEVLGGMFRQVIRKHDGHAFAMLWPVYMIEKNEQTDAAMPESRDLGEHPDAREFLVVWGTDREGHVECWLAPVLRDGEQPPALGEWAREVIESGAMFRFLAMAQAAVLRLPDFESMDSEAQEFGKVFSDALDDDPALQRKLLELLANVLKMSPGDLVAMRELDTERGTVAFAAMWAKVKDLADEDREAFMQGVIEALGERLT